MEKKMTKQLTRKWANFHVVVIGIFHLISGTWQFLLGTSGKEGISFEAGVFLEIYATHVIIFAPITIVVSILLLLKLNFARLSAIALAWWNLFFGPFVLIYWGISTNNLCTSSGNLFEFILLVTIILIRIYIIRMLNISRAGYVFLDKNKQKVVEE